MIIRAPLLSDAPHIRHGFFTRAGGVSQGIYASLNAGPGSNDTPAHVRANRARIASCLSVAPDALITLHQEHGTRIVEATEDSRAAPREAADGLVSRTPGLALGILTADCAPLLLADPKAGVIGAAHAGWRGALAGIATRIVEAAEALGASRARLLCATGPCISAKAYEVGPEFRARFCAAHADNARFFAPLGERFLFDLGGFLAHELKAAGAGSVWRARGCTYTDAQVFFSHRRAAKQGEADYGRQLAAICLAP